MHLKIDISTWLVLHYEQTLHGAGVARFICDIYQPDGTPFLGDPRSTLKRALQTLPEHGFKTFNVGLEPEFYLLHKAPTTPNEIDLSDAGSYFDQAPTDGSEACRREIMYELERLDFLVEASHHEVGNGQNEITWKYADALETADKLLTFKAVVHHVARRHNLVATFMPKPYSLLAGNGMHTNVSLFDADGNNVFYDATTQNQLSLTAQHFIAGILKHAKAFSTLTNPTVNSYKRLVPGFEAPCYITASANNRSALVRIPSTRKLGTRIEIRCPDALANPYLISTVLLAAGLDGIFEQALPAAEITGDIFHLTSQELTVQNIQHLPTSLHDALDALAQDTFIQSALGEHIYQSFLAIKLDEWERYNRKVSRWEIEKYFNY